jgi:hypothetical protein
MQIDPVQKWQRLTEEYRQKYDSELLELARDYADLTETAQQALRQEMRSRGLADPQAARTASAESDAWQSGAQHDPHFQSQLRLDEDDANSTLARATAGLGGKTPVLVPDEDEVAEDEAGPHDYTWYTYLCECESREQAAQLCEVLRQAKIDCAYNSSGLVYPRVAVAADQLEQARIIAAKPIPQEIIDDSKIEEPDYVVPKCPKCGAEDPILEAVEPSNTWRCEQCDAQWTEDLPETDGASQKA